VQLIGLFVTERLVLPPSFIEVHFVRTFLLFTFMFVLLCFLYPGHPFPVVVGILCSSLEVHVFCARL
jgi:hypothetical protein